MDNEREGYGCTAEAMQSLQDMKVVILSIRGELNELFEKAWSSHSQSPNSSTLKLSTSHGYSASTYTPSSVEEFPFSYASSVSGNVTDFPALSETWQLDLPASGNRNGSLPPGYVNVPRIDHSNAAQTVHRARSRSEPPSSTKRALGDGIATVPSFAGSSPRTGGELSQSGDVEEAASRKRKAIGEGSGGNDDHNNNDDKSGSGKRQKTVDDGDLAKDRFPCIFNIGEPNEYSAHTKRYDHISHLL